MTVSTLPDNELMSLIQKDFQNLLPISSPVHHPHAPALCGLRDSLDRSQDLIVFTDEVRRLLRVQLLVQGHHLGAPPLDPHHLSTPVPVPHSCQILHLACVLLAHVCQVHHQSSSLSGADAREVLFRFDGGEINSDAGGVLLRELKQRTRFLDRLGQCLTDDRIPIRIEHSFEALFKQRVWGQWRKK